MRRWLLIAFLALLPACKSSRGEREHWHFALSRSFYENTDWDDIQLEGGPGAAAFFGCVLLLPLAIDVALLPITVPHDVFFAE